MKKSILTLSLGFVSAAGLALGANSVNGQYIEARTADVYVGACFANSEVGNVGELAVMGWRIARGSFNGVTLDGLSVVGAIKAKARRLQTLFQSLLQRCERLLRCRMRNWRLCCSNPPRCPYPTPLVSVLP